MSSSLRIRQPQLEALNAGRRRLLEQRVAAQLARLAAKWGVPCSHSRLDEVSSFAGSRAPSFDLHTERDVFLFACLVLMAELDAPPTDSTRWVWQALEASGVSGAVKLERIYTDSRTAAFHPNAGAPHE